MLRQSNFAQRDQLALIALGEDLMQGRQHLPPHGIGGPAEQHLNLGIVALGRVLRHPAAGLKVEVLEIVAGSFATGLLGEDLAVPAALAPAVDAWQILEEKP
jgi:hypothetical protein